MAITQSTTWWHHTLDIILQHHTPGKTAEITYNGQSFAITILHWHAPTGQLVCSINNKPFHWQLLCPQACHCLRWYNHRDDITVTLHRRRPQAQRSASTQKSFAHELKSPLGGKVLKTLISPGTFVTKDTPLLVIESMKMENEIRAPHDAFIKTVSIQSNDVVEADQLLIVFSKKGPPNGTKSPANE